MTTKKPIDWGGLSTRQLASLDDIGLDQRRLLRMVERITGMTLPAKEFGVVVIDTAKPQQDHSHDR